MEAEELGVVTDIFCRAEKQIDGVWQVIPGLRPFDGQPYRLQGFLAGVRNYAAIQPISAPRGLPDGASIPDEDEMDALELSFEEYLDRGWIGEHDFSWLAIDELLAVDYDAMVEDRRCSGYLSSGIRTGAATCAPGEGQRMLLRDFLGEAYFADLDSLVAAGTERIVFGFGS